MTVTVDSEVLRAVFKAISTQVETVKVRPSEDGWQLYGRSAEGISMVNVRIPAGAFSAYEVWKDVCVDVRDILEPLSKGQGPVTLDISSGRLDIKIGRLSFRRKLVADIDVEPRMPSLTMDTEFIATASALNDVLAAASTAGDLRFKAIRLEQTATALKASVFSDDSDIGTVSAEIPAGEFIMLSGEAAARYPAGAWVELVKAIPKDAEADIQYSRNYPMMISYDVGGAEVRMLLAPQIEEDEK